MNAPVRYELANTIWPSLPTCSRIEAERAARALFRRFGGKLDYPRQPADARFRRVRRCWIASRPDAGLNRGWRRIVHDVSHEIFRLRYPQFRPHHPLHARLENEIAAYVVHETDWMRGGLKAAAKDRSDEERASDQATARASLVLKREERARKALARNESKLKRQQKLVAKWRAKVRYYDRVAAKRGTQ